MARQKSDRRIEAQGDRKAVPTAPFERGRGAKATTVEQQTWQLGLSFETAEFPQGTDGGAVSHRRATAPHAAPKSKGKEKTVTSATMEEADRLAAVSSTSGLSPGAPAPSARE